MASTRRSHGPRPRGTAPRADRQLASLLEELLGKPSRRAARQWRWNRRGSLSAVMSGAKVGTWFDHAAGSGGGPFELIARQRGGDWRDAADWAWAWLGMPAWAPAERAPTPVLEVVLAPPANDVNHAEQRRIARRPPHSRRLQRSRRDLLEPRPPRLALPVGVGIGKTRAMQRSVAGLLRSEALRGRKIVIGVPRDDLAEEQREAFRALDLDAMVWKGRTAPDPTPDNPERLMCHDRSAPIDAMEVERIVETTRCKVTRCGVTHICPLYKSCGYQAQKPRLEATQVVLTAHDTRKAASRPPQRARRFPKWPPGHVKG